jgi:HK97 family phage major capsid protein
MLESVKLQKRQSEIRQQLATLAGKENPEENEIRSMTDLDKEYSTNEVRYRASLIAEDHERKEAGQELEGRSEKEYSELVRNFELRQVALALDEGFQLTGQTAEVVQEMRSHGGYQGIPIPLAALETRAGETIASGTPDPIQTRPIIDRLFPGSVAAKMGGSLINIQSGQIEWPVATGGAVVGWGASELGDVGAATQYTTVDKSLKPDYNMGAQMTISRKALKQSGSALEEAVRRDLNAAIATELDRVVFLGAGSSGEPLGIVTGAGTYGFDVNAIDAAASYSAFRAAAVEFLTRNAATSFKDIRILLRHELLNTLDDTVYEVGSAVTEFDRIVSRFGAVMSTGNALAAPTGSPLASSAVMTTSVGGVAPFFVGIWGGVDLIRDQFTKAASGQLVLTGLVTADVTASRAAQVGILTGLQ